MHTRVSPKSLIWDDYFDADQRLGWNQIAFLARKRPVPNEMRITLWCDLLKLSAFQERDSDVEPIRDHRDVKTVIQDVSRTAINVTNRMEFEYHLLIAIRKFLAVQSDFGYIQGMNEVAGTLLITFDLKHDLVFYALSSLLERFSMNAVWDLENLQGFLLEFLDDLDEKSSKLRKHLDTYKVQPIHYATQWFIPFFMQTFDELQDQIRILDCIFLGGKQVLKNIAIGILLIHKKKILRASKNVSVLKIIKHKKVKLNKVLKKIDVFWKCDDSLHRFSSR